MMTGSAILTDETMGTSETGSDTTRTGSMTTGSGGGDEEDHHHKDGRWGARTKKIRSENIFTSVFLVIRNRTLYSPPRGKMTVAGLHFASSPVRVPSQKSSSHTKSDDGNDSVNEEERSKLTLQSAWVVSQENSDKDVSSDVTKLHCWKTK